MKIIIDEYINPLRESLRITPHHLAPITTLVPDSDITVVNHLEETLLEKIKDANILIISRFDGIDFEKLSSLQWIHVTSAGVNTLPESILKSNILVTNSSGVHPIPIAEQVFGYMLMFGRRLHKALANQIIKKEWSMDHAVHNPTELYKKTIGIVGLGRIGKRIAHLAKAFDMHVLAVVHAERKKEENVDELYTIQDLDTVLEKADYVVCSLPLTKETKYLFNAEKFKKMKKHAYFINIGRGPIVHENDLIKALQDKTIAGAALDVTEIEPLPSTSELWNLDNVIITPHTAGANPHYMERVIDIFCDNLKAFLNNKPLPNLIDKSKGY